MPIPFKKHGYKINPITDEIETPQIFLVTKQLKKIGELYPVQNLKITINEVNQADEVSFTYYKKLDGKPCPCFDQLVDLAVIQVGNFGFFEINVSKTENTSIFKNVVGRSLGHAELSQILATLEINTDEDMDSSDYDRDYPTVFYRDIEASDEEDIRKKKKASSLLDRILSYAPHYRIGDVSPTLKNVQRTFSWSDTDIVSVLNDVAAEVNCIFDIQVTINEEGEAERILNAYDMQYCEHCWNALGEKGQKTNNTHTFRNIVNGVCQNCNSKRYVKDIGQDTNIFISTDNLSDEISIEGDKDSIKNCFKVVGGDDLITDTVQGLTMSANNRIMMFSEEQRKLMSKALTDKLDEYEKDYAAKQPDYEKMLETQYNIYDIVHYLQSGKMPLLEKDIKTTLEALLFVVKQISTYYKNKFYISKWENYDYTSAKTSIRNLFTTFVPQGFSFQIDTDNLLYATDKDYDPQKKYRWYGSIQIYSTDNKDDYYTLYVTENSGTYIRHGKSNSPVSYTDTGNYIANFTVSFNFADKSQEDYLSYLKQHTAYLLGEVDLNYENEKVRNWNEYSYNRLQSYYDGFKTCIDTLDDMPNEIDTSEIDTDESQASTILKSMRDNYTRIQSHIQSQMSILLDQIFALNTYLGEYSSEFTDSDGTVWYTMKNFSSVSEALDNMIDPKYIGGYATNADGTVDTNTFIPNQYIGTKPCKCKKCNSINVSVVTEGNNICNNCGSTDIYSYYDIMDEIVKSYEEHQTSHPNRNLSEMREEMRNQFDLKGYFNNDSLYKELLSFMREDVYQNENYTSDGLSNSQLITQAKELVAKAKQELSKACMSQYTVTSPVCAIVAQTAFEYQGVMVNDNYSGFILNNYVRVRIDDEIYKMRIASIDLNFPITDKIDVTFTNVSRYTNGAMSDVASILESASNMATSYHYVATQAEKGQQANSTFETIKNEGLNAGLMAVKGGRNQDVVIDNHGILLRKKIEEIDDYSPYQMKIINRNIVLTYNNWEDAAMAIGLMTYNRKQYYGICADVIIGDLLAGNKVTIYGGGDGTTDGATVIIDGNGITLDGGAITWTKPIESSAVKGLNECLGVTEITSDFVISPKIGGGYLYIKDIRKENNTGISVEINPSGTKFDENNDKYVFNVAKNNKVVMGVKNNGDGYFSGEIIASSGKIGGWAIKENSLITQNGSPIYQYKSNTNDDPAMRIVDGKAIFGKYRSDASSNFYENDGYADISCLGVYAGSTRANALFLFAANTKDSTVSLGGTVKIYNGLRLYEHDGSTNYCWLSSSFMGNLASDAYLTARSSMSVQYKLQVGYNDGLIYRDHTFIVNGSSYVTGPSYTNDGTAVTSDRNKKNSISTPSTNYIKLFDALDFRQFKYNEGTSDRFHLGVIAQELEEAMNKVGMSSQDFGGLVVDEQGNYFVRYDEINMLTALKVKELEERIDELEERLNSLGK